MNLFKDILYILLRLLYPLSRLFIRHNNRYTFGSYGNAFNDNAKYLFIHTATHRPDIQAAWLSGSRATVAHVRSLGFRAYYTYSPKGLLHALTSRYWFYNSYTSDILYCLAGGAVCVNLWHGVGIKRIEYNILTGPLGQRYQRTNFREVLRHPQAFRKPDYILSSTPYQTHFFSTSFRVDPARCLELGYPRNTILTADETVRADFIRRYEPQSLRDIISQLQSYNRVYLYMPTWRDSQRDLFTQSMDLARFNDLLVRHNELLILKPHSNVRIDDTLFHFSNIRFLPGGVDIYPLMAYTSVLITDYSSVIYDYLLMPGKDVILYLYDYKDYTSERNFFYPYAENVAGRWVYDFDTLLQVIDQHDYALPADDRQHILDRFWGPTAHHDPSAAILDHFFCER